MLQIRTISPENFDPNVHQLPIAGELLLAGVTVTIDDDGQAHELVDDDERPVHGVVIGVSKPGDVVEVAVPGEQQDDGGFYFSQICVLQVLN